MESKILSGHGKVCEKCEGKIFTINVTTVHEVIVNENGEKLGVGKNISTPALGHPFATVKRCVSCGTLNRIGDW